MKDKILVFIPMYNCEKQIVRVIDQLTGDIRPYIDEVIIVNNRSTDNGETAVIDKLKIIDTDLKIKLLRNNENYGLGGSHKLAFKYAIENNFDYIIVLHGDDQGSIADFIPLLKEDKQKEYDCILGARFMKGSSLPGYSKFRVFGNRVFNILFSIVLGKRIYDLGAGLNMYSVRMLKEKYYFKFPDNLTFNCYMLFATSILRQKFLFTPISWREDDQISNVKMTKQAIQTLKMLLLFGLRRTAFLYKEARTLEHRDYTCKLIYENKE